MTNDTEAGLPERSFFRFFDKVLIGDGCWEWTGALDGHGYGHFWD